MRKVLLLAALLVLMGNPAYADKDKKLDEFINIALYQTMSSSLEPMIQQITTPIGCEYQLDEEGKEIIKKGISKMFASLQMRTERIIRPIYEKNFTETELDELLTYYKSPTMQKMIALTPLATKESMKQMESFSTDVVEIIMPMVKQLEEKYPKRSTSEIQLCIQEKMEKNQ